jgi:CBS domain-containing protein
MSVRRLLKGKSGRVVSVGAEQTVAAAVQLLVEHLIGGLPVVDGTGALMGFVSEREIVDGVQRHGRSVHDLDVRAIMRHPAPTCGPDEPLRAVMGRMTRERLRHLVVVDDGKVAGVISVGDLVKHRLDEVETEAGVLRDYVAGQRARS